MRVSSIFSCLNLRINFQFLVLVSKYEIDRNSCSRLEHETNGEKSSCSCLESWKGFWPGSDQNTIAILIIENSTSFFSSPFEGETVRLIKGRKSFFLRLATFELLYDLFSGGVLV